METKTIQTSLNLLLDKGKNEDTKMISLNLPKKLLGELDLTTDKLSKLLDKNISRQALIESAIGMYLGSLNDLLLTTNLTDIVSKPTIYDTLIVPAQLDRGKDEFFNDHKWSTIRIGKNRNLDQLKYLAIYWGSPVSAVTHYAEIKSIVPLPGGGFEFILDKPLELFTPVTLGHVHPSTVRSNRYLLLKDLKAAKTFDDLIKL